MFCLNIKCGLFIEIILAVLSRAVLNKLICQKCFKIQQIWYLSLKFAD